MKKLLLIIVTFALSFQLFAQEEISREEWRKMSRQERKEYKQKVAEEKQQVMMQVLTSRAWVLESYQLQDKYGESAPVEPSINFIGIAGDLSTVQLGSSGDIGWNGVGGITVEGEVRSYDLKEGKKAGSGAHIRMEVSGASSGHISVAIHISADGTAAATISDNMGDRLTYRGRIVPLAESTVYKGQRLF